MCDAFTSPWDVNALGNFGSCLKRSDFSKQILNRFRSSSRHIEAIARGCER